MSWSPPGADGESAGGATADDEPFAALVEAALDGLPDVFRERLGSVAIVVEDEPTRDQLRSVGAHGLYGLYQGVPRTAWAADSALYASKITIFRGPLTRSARSPEDLARLVTETVHHEIAHHFGISDDRLRELAKGRR
jgi:predicted Zn-dependent protease with MMP-like domain